MNTVRRGVEGLRIEIGYGGRAYADMRGTDERFDGALTPHRNQERSNTSIGALTVRSCKKGPPGCTPPAKYTILDSKVLWREPILDGLVDR
jgi:hypothetical protein